MYGWKWQEYYSADYRYIPLVESPGVAFIIIEKEGLSPSQRLVNEVFATWPYMVITTLLAALAGIVIWFLVGNNLLARRLIYFMHHLSWNKRFNFLVHVWKATFKRVCLGKDLWCLVFMSFPDLKTRQSGQEPHCCCLSRAFSCEFSLSQDTKSNPDHFPRTFLRGSGNGFWWAFISMTTLG